MNHLHRYKLTDSFDGRDLTPKNFYRKSNAGRKKAAQQAADEHGHEVIMTNERSQTQWFFEPSK